MFVYKVSEQLNDDYVCIQEVYELNSTEKSPTWEANGSSATQEIPTFYGTRRLITAFTRIRHLSLSWTRSIQSMPHSTIRISILILFFHLRLGLPRGLHLSGLSAKTLHAPLLSIHAICFVHLIIPYFIARIIFDEEYRARASVRGMWCIHNFLFKWNEIGLSVMIT